MSYKRVFDEDVQTSKAPKIQIFCKRFFVLFLNFFQASSVICSTAAAADCLYLVWAAEKCVVIRRRMWFSLENNCFFLRHSTLHIFFMLCCLARNLFKFLNKWFKIEIFNVCCLTKQNLLILVEAFKRGRCQARKSYFTINFTKNIIKL